MKNLYLVNLIIVTVMFFVNFDSMKLIAIALPFTLFITTHTAEKKLFEGHLIKLSVLFSLSLLFIYLIYDGSLGLVEPSSGFGGFFELILIVLLLPIQVVLALNLFKK